jgi:2'-5' RNA ligase
MEASRRMHRLFFALWPTDALRDRLAAAVRPIVASSHSRAIPAENFHITLAFLGTVPTDNVPRVMEAASQIVAAPFVLSIERLESWRSAHLLCLTPRPSGALQKVVDDLRCNLLARGIEPDQKEFRPHVTVAREWTNADIDGSIGAFNWPADDIVLIESQSGPDGSRYQIKARWPLTAEGRS